jgi:hypothetical protein
VWSAPALPFTNKELDMKFYVYILRDPRPDKDLQPIYVGKGKGARARTHWRDADDHYNPLMRRVLTRIKNLSLKPTIEIVRRFEVEADAFQLEIELIAKYGRRDLATGTLCNLTDGGEGGSGHIATESQREYLRQRHANDPEFRKSKSELMKRINADPVISKANAELMRQRHTDPEFAKANAERVRARNVDPVFIKANAERIRKAYSDPAVRERTSEAVKRRLADDPVFAAAEAERLRQRNADPEFRKKQAAAMTRLHADPIFVKAHVEGIQRQFAKPGAREAVGERLRRLHADPVFAKAHAERMRKRHADPEFAKARDELLRKRNADPEFQAKCKAARAAKRLARNAATNQVRERLATGPI